MNRATTVLFLQPFYFFFLTFFAPLALTPKCLDLQKFAFNLFCREDQELSVEYFRFLIAQKLTELRRFSCDFFSKNSKFIIFLLNSFCAAGYHAKMSGLTKIAFHLFCREEQELSEEYFRFFKA